MKILIAADIFPPESGGPATYAVTLANELVKQGVEVVIVSLNPHSDVSKVTCPVYRVATGFKPLRYAHFYYLLKKHGRSADVIYAMGPVNAGYPAGKAAKKLGKKFVVKVVGDYAWEQGQAAGLIKDTIDDFQKKNLSGKIGWLQKTERRVVAAADAVITPAEYLKKIVVGWGADPKKVFVIKNAVECIDVPPAPKPAGEKWIVSAARLLPWKGMATLVESLPDILRADPSVRLMIVGDGPERKNIQAVVQKLKLEYAVALLGNLPRTTTLGIIKSADVFVLNSGYEGLSHVILEAQNFGVPVLASASGGNPEIVSPYHLFEYNNSEAIKDKIISTLASEPVGAPQAEKNMDGEAFDAQWEKELLMIAETLKVLKTA